MSNPQNNTNFKGRGYKHCKLMKVLSQNMNAFLSRCENGLELHAEYWVICSLRFVLEACKRKYMQIAVWF